MTLVWALELPDSEKIVLLALADCANDEGHCWPGMKSLVRKCSKTDRTIQAAIKSLCDKGHLTRREVPGKGCNYTVHPRKDFAPEEASPPKPATETPEAVSGKPSVTINSEAKASYAAVIDLWNELSAASGIPAVRVVNNSRKQMLNARIKEHGLETMLEAVRRVHASPFCRGGEGARRKADIMYILQPTTLARVLEGFYGFDKRPIAIDPSTHAQNKRELADLYDKMGRSDEAAKLRREAAALIQKCATARAA
jgi:hypothetical protein